MSALTDEEWNVDAAAELVTVLRDTETGEKSIGILDETGDRVVHELDKHLARAVAVRLVELAALLPEPPRILRRSSALEDELRDREGGA